jgi:hypothetical protein
MQHYLTAFLDVRSLDENISILYAVTKMLVRKEQQKIPQEKALDEKGLG